MYIKNKFISICYKIILTLICLISVLFNTGILTGKAKLISFTYFTTLSNLLCGTYFLLSIIFLIIHYKDSSTYTFSPTLKGIVIMCIMITCLISNFIIKIEYNFSITTFFSFNLHCTVPIMALFDWVLFDQKGNFKKYSPLTWTILPYLYLIITMICGIFTSGLGNRKNSKYPYFFLDIDKIGFNGLIINIVFLSICFIILGYFIYFIDYKLSKKSSFKMVKS